MKLQIVRLALFALMAVPALYATPAGERIACFSDHRGGWENRDFKRKLWDGYEISLGPARNGNGNGEGNDCTAAIYNLAGKVVFRTTGFNVKFDQELTGRDFNGDGKPEVVFQTDSGGGMHCCWAYNVISLSPNPR